MRRDCVFWKFWIFPLLEKATFFCFLLEKMLISLFLLPEKFQKWHFLIREVTENQKKKKKSYLFVYFHIFTPCNKMWFVQWNEHTLLVIFYQPPRCLLGPPARSFNFYDGWVNFADYLQRTHALQIKQKPLSKYM